MCVIEKFLTGETEAKDFISMLKTDNELQNSIRTLIPNELRNHPEHPFWKKIYYYAFQEYDFDCMEYIMNNYLLDNSIGDNLNIFSDIQVFYSFRFPTLKCTNRYEEEFSLFLDAVGDRFEGPEVQETIERIIREALDIKPKTKRIKAVKEKINEVFHVEDRKNYPRWIQGAEWPMGESSPMRFIKQERKGEEVLYYFQDVDNANIRTISQFY